jgi:uncharacterized protein (DUF433 family)
MGYKKHCIRRLQIHLQWRDTSTRSCSTVVAMPAVLSQREFSAIIRAVTATSMKAEKHMTPARISTEPAVMMGKPCIRGTRITVELILRKLSAGRSFADLLEAYPQLAEDDLRAALAFAADYMQHETVLAAE